MRQSYLKVVKIREQAKKAHEQKMSDLKRLTEEGSRYAAYLLSKNNEIPEDDKVWAPTVNPKGLDNDDTITLCMLIQYQIETHPTAEQHSKGWFPCDGDTLMRALKTDTVEAAVVLLDRLIDAKYVKQVSFGDTGQELRISYKRLLKKLR